MQCCLGNLGTWHSCERHLTCITHTNTVADQAQEFGGWVDILSFLSHSLGHPWAVFAVAALIVLPGEGPGHQRVLIPWVALLGLRQSLGGLRLLNARTQGFRTKHYIVTRWSKLLTSHASGFNVVADRRTVLCSWMECRRMVWVRSLGFVTVNSSRPQSVFSMKRQTTKVWLQLFLILLRWFLVIYYS